MKDSLPLGTKIPLGELSGRFPCVTTAIGKALAPSTQIVAMTIDRPHGGTTALRLVGAHDAGMVLIWDLEVQTTAGVDSVIFGRIETARHESDRLPAAAAARPVAGLPSFGLGLTSTMAFTVTPSVATDHLGGDHHVLGTPDMIRMMERCAAAAVRPHLEVGWSSVGVHVDIEHRAPADVGDLAIVTAHLIAIRGARLEWEVDTTVEGRTVGSGSHEHHLVQTRA